MAFVPVMAVAQIAFRATASATVASGAIAAITATAGTFAERTDCGDITPSLPAGSTGDLLVAQVVVRDQNAVATMAGWTSLYAAAVAGQNYKVYLFWRSATGTDGNTINQAGGSCEHIMARITRFGNVDTAQPLQTQPLPAGNASYQDAASMTTGTQATAVANSMVVAATFTMNDRTVAQGDGFTQIYDDADNSGNDAAISLNYRIDAATGAKGPFTWTLSGTGNDPNHGVLFAVRPATVATLTVAKPAGTLSGDVMTASITVRPCSNTSGAVCTTTVTAPAGWVEVGHVDQTTGAGTGGYGHRLYVYRLVAGAAEPATYTWTIGGAPTHAGAAGGILAFSGVDTTDPVVAFGGQTTVDAYSHATSSIDTGTVTNTMLVATHTVNSSGTWTPPGTMTERVDVLSYGSVNNLGLSLEVSTEARAAAGATGTRTATLSNPPASDTGATFLLALRPAPIVPTADYRFDECALTSGSAGAVKDSSGNNRHATPYNAAVSTPGRINNATDFTPDGTGDYLVLDHTALNGLTEFTISLWFKTAVSKAQQEILQGLGTAGVGFDDLEIYIVNTNGIVVNVRDSADLLYNTPVVTDNAWHHLAFTRSGATGCLYIDGALTSCKNTYATTALSLQPGALIVGQEQDSYGGSFTTAQNYRGYLDELKFFATAMSATDVAAIRTNELAGNNWNGSSRSNPCVSVDHVEFVHDGSALTCSAEPITVLACTTPASCYGVPANQYTAGTVTISPAAIAGAQWCADALCVTPLTIPAAVNNGDIIYLRDTSTGVDRVGGTTPTASNATIQCTNTTTSPAIPPNSTTACDIDFASSGFLVSVPNHRSCANSTLTVEAISTGGGGRCVPEFRNRTRTVSLSFAYSDPATGTRVPIVAGTAISTSGTNVSLNFDNDGIATPTFVYPDAGRLSITASYAGPPVMTGSTSTLPIIAPNAFVFSGIPAAPLTAGLPFNATVKAVTTANAAVPVCVTPDAAPNFQSSSVVVTSSNPVPGLGNATTINTTLGAFTNGVASTNLTWNEVGTIDLAANLANYLSASPAMAVTGSVAGVGRFKPAYFDTLVTPGCGAFTYAGLNVTGPPAYSLAGQPITVTVKAKRFGGDATNATNTANYAGATWAKAVTLSDAGGGTGTLANTALAATDFSNGSGSRADVAYSFPNKLTAPYTLAVRATDADMPAVSSSGHAEGSTEMRSGRLRLFNAFGSEKADIQLPVQAQYWSGSSWVLNSADSCTNVAASAFVLSGAPAGTSASAVAIGSGNGMLTLSKPSPVTTANVDVAINLGATGAALASCVIASGGTAANLPWLRSQNGNCAATFDRDPSARATFGIYAPETRKTIHIRELY